MTCACPIPALYLLCSHGCCCTCLCAFLPLPAPPSRLTTRAHLTPAGVPSVIREHPVTHRMAYTGQVLRMATAVCDAGGGGGCLLDPVTFRGIHASLDSLDLLAPDVTLIAGE